MKTRCELRAERSEAGLIKQGCMKAIGLCVVDTLYFTVLQLQVIPAFEDSSASEGHIEDLHPSHEVELLKLSEDALGSGCRKQDGGSRLPRRKPHYRSSRWCVFAQACIWQIQPHAPSPFLHSQQCVVTGAGKNCIYDHKMSESTDVS